MQRFGVVATDCGRVAILNMRTAWLSLLLLGCPQISKDTGGAEGAETGGSTDSGGLQEGPVDPLANIDPSELAQGDSPCRGPVYVEVQEVVDGDTINVMSGRGVERVRLIGIDATEVDHDGDWDECWSEEAKAFVDAQIGGRHVWLTFDAECEDDYDRTLAYVHARIGDEGFLQRALLLEGWVSTFAVSPNTSFESTFEGYQSTARSAGLGLWGACSR
jgi:micrococcal nuclease